MQIEDWEGCSPPLVLAVFLMRVFTKSIALCPTASFEMVKLHCLEKMQAN